jgi:16S rRNA (guanine527-N7)-methyltransferase
LGRAGVEPGVAEPIARYGIALLESNQQYNLTGAKTVEALLPELLDSLTIVPHLKTPYVDVGSGGGMPAIPAALAAGVRLTMIESSAKKAAFLEAVLNELKLDGVVLRDRAELAGQQPDLRETFAAASGRAVGTAPTVAELLLPLLARGGLAILQRGRLEAQERAALEDAALMLGGRLLDEKLLCGDRRILLLEKVGKTPERFPRRPGIPEKRPLCMRR